MKERRWRGGAGKGVKDEKREEEEKVEEKVEESGVKSKTSKRHKTGNKKEKEKTV